MGEAMALSIKTDRRQTAWRAALARLHGETLTEAVTTALRERCGADCATRTPEEKRAALRHSGQDRRPLPDKRPVTLN